MGQQAERYVCVLRSDTLVVDVLGSSMPDGALACGH